MLESVASDGQGREESGRAPAGFGRRRRVLLAGAAGIAALAAGLWIERKPIATRLVDRTLAADEVPARYRIADLGPGRQRLTTVVLGDPRHPDLVADWVETRTSLGLDGVHVTGVSAGRVRVRGRIVGGRLSLGSLDRLLPASSAGAATLPALALALGDARLRLDTPAGPVEARLSGSGRLDRDFAGRLSLAAPALAAGGCRVTGAAAALRVRTGAGTIALSGPANAAAARCAQARLADVTGDLDVSLPPDAARWRGTLRLAAAGFDHPAVRARALAGSARFAGDRRGTAGDLALEARGIDGGAVAAARGALTGRFAVGAVRRLDAELVASGAAVAPRLVAAIRRSGGRAAGLPVAPIVEQAVAALARAASGFGGTAQLALVSDAAGARATLFRAALAAGSGATARFEGSLPMTDPRATRGSLAVAGGGLPTADLSLAPGPDGGVAGRLVAQPYAAAGARLALAPVAWDWRPGVGVRATTTATLSGPLGDGRVEKLALPLAVAVDPRGAISVGEGCTPVGFERLAVGGLTLGRTRLTLCPTGGALVRVAGGTVAGGARTGPIHLAGRLGGSVLDLSAAGARVGADGTVALAAPAVTLGDPARPTHFAATAITARIGGGAVAGRVEGLGGTIAAVPLLLAEGRGRWRFAAGLFTLDGAVEVLDSAARDPRACSAAGAAAGLRFCPLRAERVALRLERGRIAATGTLVEPTTGTRVAGVGIAHDLASGQGHADLSVDALAFRPGFQPTRLTPIVEGVVADVAGTVDGTARIGWDARGVTSTGRFATAGTDLATAFGPVTGITGSIAFTDLLSLTSAPGQVLSVRSINPGIAVENGTVRFHTGPGAKVAVEDARWPFAGGTLTLDPTLLDFTAPAERRMTFRVQGIAADRFLQQFDFRNLAATGTFDGVLPMVFDAAGGRIEHGSLAVRKGGAEGGGTVAYVGDLSAKDLGFWGNTAFQALKSLRYRSLAITMNGPLAGEMVTQVRFAGGSQGKGAESNFIVRRLQRLPFVFNVRITAPFRTLLDGLDPARQVQLNLPRLIEEERRGAGGAAVQPPASAAVP